jgi:hypothetical protein
LTIPASEKADFCSKIKSISSLFFLGFEMFSLLIVFLCGAIAALCEGFGIFSRNSRLRGIKSRLGLRKFPFRAATGIWPQGFELVKLFGGQIAAVRAESKKIPLLREKPGMRRRKSRASLREVLGLGVADDDGGVAALAVIRARW